MTVFALIPVHNRIEHTKECIACLRKQIGQPVHIMVIDDGSTDDTAGYLADQKGISVITGNGNLWWTGAMQKGLDAVMRMAEESDYVLFLNNDTVFDNNLAWELVRVSQDNDSAIVGSILRDRENPARVLSLGPAMDIWRMRIWDRYELLTQSEKENLADIYTAPALSGRGTLIPVSVLKWLGPLPTRCLPHYGADYEFTARAARRGHKVLVSTTAVVQSWDNFGVQADDFSCFEKYFGHRSVHNIFKNACFYMLVGNPLQRVTALPRMLYFSMLSTGSRILYKTQVGLRGLARRILHSL